MTARLPKITNHSIVHFWPGLSKSQVFLFGWLFNLQELRSTRAAPLKSGSAKTRRQAMLRNLKVLSIVAVVIILAISTYAFAAANTVPATKAGDGLGVVSGYTVTNVVYTLNGSDPSTLDSVSFDLGAAAAAGKVKAQLVATTGTWYACTNTTGTVWSCDTTGLTASSIDQLRVIAASN
jgi:hypothetical protein